MAFGAIAIGALVPAAIMSIAAANLFTRNIYKAYLKPAATDAQEAAASKIVSLVTKVGALVFVLAFSKQYAINLQLLGGVWILQTLPAIVIGLYTRWFHRWALLIGWAVGMAYGTWLDYGVALPGDPGSHAANGRTRWPEGADALHRPVYTVAAQQDDWLDFDIFRHDGSPTCDWAEAARPGDTVGVIGPGGGWCPEAPRLWLFGDETALPAIARMLDLARGEVRAHLRCAPEDPGPLADDPRVTACPDLLAQLATIDPGPDDQYIVC